ncbi:hypothetical protein BDAP_000548 [Binucleata daphniae]
MTLHTISYVPNLQAIEERKKIKPFGKFANQNGKLYIKICEKPIKFNRQDELIEIEENKDDNGGYYEYKPIYESAKKERKEDGDFYVPPSLQNVQTSVKINNLPLNINRHDLEKIFINNFMIYPDSTYVVLDYESKESKGYAYVSFGSLENAKEAIKAIDGFVIDSLIISAEISKN